MRDDLYAVLGVEHDATADQIRSAYRKRARETHPDTVGEGRRAEFERVQAAYEVLGEKVARAYYDATGQTGVKPGDVPSSEEILLRLFGQAVDTPPPGFEEFANPLLTTAKLLGLLIDEIGEDLVQTRHECARLLRIQRRLVRGPEGGEKLLEGMLESRIAPVKKQIAHAELYLSRITGATKLLSSYRLRPEFEALEGGAKPASRKTVHALRGRRTATIIP